MPRLPNLRRMQRQHRHQTSHKVRRESWRKISPPGRRDFLCTRARRRFSEKRRNGREANFGSEPLHEESRKTTTSEETILPQRPEVANRGRRSHQRAQTAPWTESLSLSRRGWHATVGGPGGDCRQSDQYRSIPGSNKQRIEIKPRAAITKRGKRKDGDKTAARKEPTGWVQGIASPRSLFLRRKVATRSFDKVQRQD